MPGSYQINQFTTHIESEVHRLKAQVELFFEQEFKKYCELGLKDGQEIIECGCGPGFLLKGILDRLPACRATGLEIDPYLLEILKSNAGQEGKRLFDVVAGSIADTGLEDNRFDVVLCRLVLEHLPDPLPALAELYRILKPGGKVIIVSNDFTQHLITYPHIPELDRLYAAYCASQFKKGGNPQIGRQLPYLLARANFTALQLDVVCAHNVLQGDKALFKAQDVNIASQLVKEGYLEKEALDAITRAWYAMLQTEGHVLYRQLFVVSGAKAVAGMPHPAYGLPLSAKGIPGSTQSANRPPGAYLAEILAEILGVQADAVKPDVILRDLGLDSIGALELSNILSVDYSQEIPIADLLESFTLAALVQKITLI